MEKLTKEAFTQAERFITEKGRNLEKARCEAFFKNGKKENVVNELKTYQNDDGGFGNWLEPDFSLPASSPIASTIAFQILDEIDCKDDELGWGGITYFCTTFDKERNGWYAVPREVNNFPHASWWHFDTRTKMTIIDKNWGNPSAEIVGYLYQYRAYHDLSIGALIEYAVNYLLTKEKFTSEHEIYCFIRLFNTLPQDKKRVIEKRLTEAVQSLVCTDPEEWKNYVPQPVHFVPGPDSVRFGIRKREIETNLDYLVSLIEKYGAIYPTWEWGQYGAFWEKAQVQWAVILTLQSLNILYKFNRIYL